MAQSPKQPEHWKDTAPNEPEPRTFLREVPAAAWWMFAALGLFTVAVLGWVWLV